MTAKILPTLICAILLVSCGRSGTKPNPFFGSFDPVVTLDKVGSKAGITYFRGSKGSSFDKGLFGGAVAQKDWSLSFEGNHTQLAAQLDEFKAEVERQLLSSGAEIHGRGTWAGNFSGFNFDYSSYGRHGFVRVTGVSLENKQQAIEIFLYEY
jgi:hypothetical protein